MSPEELARFNKDALLHKLQDEADKKDTIEIKEVTLSRMIEYMREYIFELTGDEDSDRATHPLDMPFLDYLIELRDNNRRKKNGQD